MASQDDTSGALVKPQNVESLSRSGFYHCLFQGYIFTKVDNYLMVCSPLENLQELHGPESLLNHHLILK